jgi:hypothetical protein
MTSYHWSQQLQLPNPYTSLSGFQISAEPMAAAVAPAAEQTFEASVEVGGWAVLLAKVEVHASCLHNIVTKQ